MGTLYGFEDEAIDKLINEAIAFDALLVPVTKSSVEKADYVKLYNPRTREDIQSKTASFDLMGAADGLVGQEVDQLICMDPDFIDAFDSIINEENFNLIKSWMIISNALKFAANLTDELRIAGGAYMRALSGTKEAQ